MTSEVSERLFETIGTVYQGSQDSWDNARTAELAFHFRDCFTFIGLNYQCVLRHLEFAGQSCSLTVKDKESPENIKQRVIGIVSGFQSEKYESRLKELDKTTLEEKRTSQTCCKCTNYCRVMTMC
jgi:hypothetical protein